MDPVTTAEPACTVRPRPSGSVDRRGRRSEVGQAAVVVVVIVAVLVVVISVALATMGRTVIDRARAQTAADAAALASLEGGRAAAAELAGLHGAVVTGWSAAGFEVTVTVRLGGVSATGTATNAP